MPIRPKTPPHSRKKPLKLPAPPLPTEAPTPAEDPHDAAFFVQMRECREPYRRLGDAIIRIVSPMGEEFGRGATVFDIGCGVGLQTGRFMECGWVALGAEHSPVAVEYREDGVNIVPFDLTKPKGARLSEIRNTRWDIVVCTETAEHIPTEHSAAIVKNVVDAVTKNGVIVWSAAAPGQEWHGHINLQKPEFWLELFAAHGWVPEVARTGALRDLMQRTQAQHWMGKENFFVLVPQKRKQLHFTITSTVLNGADYIARHIQSVQRQTYRNFTHYVIDAKSTDATLARARAEDKRHVDGTIFIQNKQKRLAALENCWAIWKKLPDDEVIVWLDGDDWFAIDNALDVVARTYASPEEPWLTYGSFMFSDGRLGICSQYEPHENVRTAPWRASHLKTFRAGLVKKLNPKDMLKPDGSWCDLAIDKVVMYPLIEMAGDHHIASSHILSVYNTHHSWWAQRSDAERQIELDEVARLQQKNPYPRVKRPW